MVDGGESASELWFRLDSGGERISPGARGDSPIRDRARRVDGEDVVEQLCGGAELERV
jgi:hypothetical protein